MQRVVAFIHSALFRSGCSHVLPAAIDAHISRCHVQIHVRYEAGSAPCE